MTAVDPAARVLLVEGVDDREVVYQLCNAHGIDNRSIFRVYARDGYDDVRQEMSVQAKSATVRALGVVVDADAEPAGRWQSLRQAIARCGDYPGVPTAPPAEGLILEGGRRRPRLGVWMMPDNARAGMLEDFLHDLAAEHDALLPRASDAVDGIPPAERRFKPSYRSKAILHTWLVWQAEPGRHAGQALKLRYLDAARGPGRAFVAWLTALFAPA